MLVETKKYKYFVNRYQRAASKISSKVWFSKWNYNFQQIFRLCCVRTCKGQSFHIEFSQIFTEVSRTKFCFKVLCSKFYSKFHYSTKKEHDKHYQEFISSLKGAFNLRNFTFRFIKWKGSAKFLVLRALMPYVPPALLTLVSHVPRALRALVLHMSRVLHALVSHSLHALRAFLPHVSRALLALVLYTCFTCFLLCVLSNLSCFVPCVLSCVTCPVPHVTCTLRALVPHVLSWFTCPSCLMPCVIHLSISLFLLFFFHALRDFFLFISNFLAFFGNLRQFKSR